jgi:hypothetical protein
MRAQTGLHPCVNLVLRAHRQKDIWPNAIKFEYFVAFVQQKRGSSALFVSISSRDLEQD